MTQELIVIATMSSMIAGGVLYIVAQTIRAEKVVKKKLAPRARGKEKR